VDPVYVTQTTIAVTIVHKIHYSIEVPKTKQKRIIGFQNIIGFFIITVWVLRQPHVRGLISTSTGLRTCRPTYVGERCATGSDVTGNDVTRSHVIGCDVTGSDVSHMIGSDVSHVTGSDVIFQCFFLTRVVVQNVPLLFFIRFTVPDYSFDIFWSLCCLSFVLLLK
jgi:hypothetical protein